MALAGGVGVPARADVWGYVDETGTARIATTQLDERYHHDDDHDHHDTARGALHDRYRPVHDHSMHLLW